MKQWLKWGLIALAGLAVLGAIFGEDSARDSGQKASSENKEQVAATTTAAASTPEPKPHANLDISDRTVHSDSSTLKGSVDPHKAKVTVNGHRLSVRHGHFRVPVTFSGAPDDRDFRFKATAPGYQRSETTVNVSREYSSAEMAVVRQKRAAARAARRAAKAAARANKRALDAAKDYLDYSAFSKQGLFEQLSSSAGAGFSEAEAQYAVDQVGADWNEQAVKAAKDYLEYAPMSREALIEQLSSSAGAGFTYDQALYAVDKVY